MSPAAIPPETVRETAQRVLTRDYYDLEDLVHPFPLAGRVLEWIRDAWDALGDLLGLVGLPIPPWLFWALVALPALGMLAWLLTRRLSERERSRRQEADEVELEDLPTDVEALLQRSDEVAQNGNYVDASRMLYRAALVRLEEQRGGFYRRGLTNTEYIRTFRMPWVIENLQVFADLIDWKWYRARRFDAEDYRRCRDAYNRLDAHLREVA